MQREIELQKHEISRKGKKGKKKHKKKKGQRAPSDSEEDTSSMHLVTTVLELPEVR